MAKYKEPRKRKLKTAKEIYETAYWRGYFTAQSKFIDLTSDLPVKGAKKYHE